MAYAGGYAYGYQDGTGGHLFTPTTAGVTRRILPEHANHGHAELWRHYGKAIPAQAHIFYTAGVSAVQQQPQHDDIANADAGSGIGDKMVWRTPTTPQYPITEAEALAIIADGTYADFVSQA